jgi:membrane fusion protein (multidrug efflux system)
MNFQVGKAAFAPAVRVRNRIRELHWTRQSLRKLLMVGVPLLVATVAFYFWFTGGRYVSTDNAYIHAPKLMVSSDVSGLVSEVLVHEGQTVKKDDVLFRIDARQFQIAVDNAKAQLAQTALNLQAMKEDYQRLLTDAASQAAQVDLAQKNYDRAADLIKRGVTSAQAFDQARTTLDAAIKRAIAPRAGKGVARLGVKPTLVTDRRCTQASAQRGAPARSQRGACAVQRRRHAGRSAQPGMYLVAATAALTNTGAVALVARTTCGSTPTSETDFTWVKPGEVEISVDSYPFLGRQGEGHLA